MLTRIAARLGRPGLVCAAVAVVAAYARLTELGPADTGPLDRLDPRQIPAEWRPAEAPRELVAAVGRPGGWPGDQICSAAVSPDMAWLAAGTRAGCVRLYEVPSLRLRWEVGGHDGAASAVAFTDNGQALASGGRDGRIRLWSLGGTPLPAAGPQPPADSPVLALAGSPDGRRLASAHPSSVRVWDVGPGGPEVTGLIAIPGCQVAALAFSPDGRRLATGGGDRMVRLWRLGGGRPGPEAVSDEHDGRVYGLAFAPDGAAVATLDWQGAVTVWGADGPRPGFGRVLPQVCLAGVFAPDGRHLLTVNGDGTVWVLRLPRRWSAP